MSDGFAALFWGIVTFSLLIVLHEGGHFFAARAFGVKVHEFMVGLPGPALRYRGKKTTYGVTAVPLGGYVRIAGMEPGPEDPFLGKVLYSVVSNGTADAMVVATDLGIEQAAADRMLLTLADWDAIEALPDDQYTYRPKLEHAEGESAKALLDRARMVTYRALPTWKRVIVLSAGVVVNLIAAVLVFTVVVSAYGIYTTRVSEVATGSAAARAGIEVGDRITAVDGHRIGSWQRLIDVVAANKPGETVEVELRRGEELMTLQAVLGENPQTHAGLLGVSPSVEKPTVIQAFAESVSYIGLTFTAIMKFFNPETASQALSQSSSIIGASYIAADAARTSALNYAGIVAMLSLSLGVINIFPIPPLDGGKILVEFIERLRGRQFSRRFSLSLSVTGATVLFALIGYLMYADVMRYVVN